jgi:hypothetical protein
MLSATHRAALRAAAKLACFSTALGCGGLVDSSKVSTGGGGGDQTPTGTASNDDGSGRADATVGDAIDAAAPALDAMALTTCRQDPLQLACCEAELFAEWPDGSTWTWKADASVPAGTRACCTVLQNYYDGQRADGNPAAYDWGSDRNLRGPCCGGVLGWQSGGTCTPWGPPVPPAMPQRRHEYLS